MYWFETSIERMAKRAAEQIGLSDSTYRQMGGRGSEYQSSVDRQRRQQELTMKPGDPRRRTDEQIRADTYNQGLHGNTSSPVTPRTSAAAATTRTAQPAVRPQQSGAVVPQGYDPEGNPVGNQMQLERQERERRMAEARGASAEANKQNRIADAQAGGNGQYMQANGTLNAPEGAEVQGEWRNGKFYPHGSQFGYTAKEVARNKWNAPAQPAVTPVAATASGATDGKRVASAAVGKSSLQQPSPLPFELNKRPAAPTPAQRAGSVDAGRLHWSAVPTPSYPVARPASSQAATLTGSGQRTVSDILRGPDVVDIDTGRGALGAANVANGWQERMRELPLMPASSRFVLYPTSPDPDDAAASYLANLLGRSAR